MGSKENGGIKKAEGAEELMTEFDKFSLKRTSDEEKKKENEEKRKTSLLTLIFRGLKLNLDILQLVAIAVIFTCFGYCLSFVVLSFSVEQIKVSIRDFFEILASIIAGALLVLWKLYTAPGAIAKSLIKSANKEDSQLDPYGRTIVGK